MYFQERNYGNFKVGFGRHLLIRLIGNVVSTVSKQKTV